MEKGKEQQQELTNLKNNQLSFEFHGKPNRPETPKVECSRVISLADYKTSIKSNIDYSKLVIKHTKSF